jgi:hypothetical protein
VGGEAPQRRAHAEHATQKVVTHAPRGILAETGARCKAAAHLQLARCASTPRAPNVAHCAALSRAAAAGAGSAAAVADEARRGAAALVRATGVDASIVLAAMAGAA